MTYLATRFTVSPNTRAVQSTWHDLVITAARTEQIFRERGDSREADQVRIYATLFTQYALKHLDRIVSSNGNGHNTDSTVGTELPVTQAAPSVNGQTPSDEKGVCVDCGHGDELPPQPPVTAVPGNDVEGKIELLIDQLGDLMAKNRDHQPYEVALKMAHRGRTLAREGKFVLAVRQLRAATNAAHGLKLEVW